MNEEYEKQQIRNFFANKVGGICVEVGAHDPISICSQSWHLEVELNWYCILVEPHPELAQKARELRPNCIVYEFACTSPSLLDVESMQFNIPLDSNHQEITGHAGLEQNADEHNYKFHKIINTKVNTLSNLLEESGIKTLDFLSVDVEGSEFNVLLGFDFQRYKPQLILLEDKHLYLKTHRLLKKNGYKLIRRLNRNGWYIPQEMPSPRVNLFETIKLFKRLYLSIWLRKWLYAWRHKTLKPFKNL